MSKTDISKPGQIKPKLSEQIVTTAGEWDNMLSVIG